MSQCQAVSAHTQQRGLATLKIESRQMKLDLVSVTTVGLEKKKGGDEDVKLLPRYCLKKRVKSMGREYQRVREYFDVEVNSNHCL